MEHLLRYASEVAQARAEGRPIVALESTVISHGLPYPENVETALAMEDAIRQQGATPATIAVLSGQIHVGLSREQIEHLAQAKNVRKCSRRDFPIALGLGEDAATTVAGTMIVAHMAGICVFATGGIGGVHRGAPFDQSADLLELGRTPVAVVCSGAKSILDLPLTLEVLETQGVPVLGYQTDDLPAFYTRHSGLPIDVRVDTPKQAAQIIRAAQAIGARHGLLIAVPVPEHLAIAAEVAERAIAQATEEAHQQGISGKAVTPFVLARVSALTEGQTKAANKALLANNAAVAAQIALALTTS
ncbi:MAG: pseudouridine-5'-phosphate glycosidase [Anaerolineae bacterium]|nr:pseudouridine-5'-phosphate glycosidase [Anaerolineae bacterium]MDW8173033.1 pseudouridine-5'-phosphate glycosidase [Anaerolineae bacterium]